MQGTVVVDLNSAPEPDLLRLPMLDREVALEILRRRPFKSWESLKQAFGMDEEFARLWRDHGAVLGVPQRPNPVPAPRPQRKQGMRKT